MIIIMAGDDLSCGKAALFSERRLFYLSPPGF
jgi:hypothetical protein